LKRPYCPANGACQRGNPVLQCKCCATTTPRPSSSVMGPVEGEGIWHRADMADCICPLCETRRHFLLKGGPMARSVSRRHLSLEDISLCRRPESLLQLLQKLGYQTEAEARPLPKEEIGFAPADMAAIRNLYLLADQGGAGTRPRPYKSGCSWRNRPLGFLNPEGLQRTFFVLRFRGT